jgi:hypothetical protein
MLLFVQNVRAGDDFVEAPENHPRGAVGGRCSVSAVQALGGDSAPPSNSPIVGSPRHP